MFPDMSILSTINMVTGFIGIFYQADYRMNMAIRSDINVIENREPAKSYEFPPEAIEAAQSIANDLFPDKFLFGAGSSAYQIEGAFHSPGKGESVWDFWTHRNPNLVRDKSNGDIACNSFVRYPDDVNLIKELGANTYRISLSWTRILPNGFSNQVSLEGIKYYNSLINTLISNGITPMVTIHHYDIPEKLQVLGGWTNPKMVDFFQDFSRAAFTYFGDRVKHWITVNDPYELCNSQYGNALKPFYRDDGVGNYLCGHHVLLAHAKVYRMYREEFKPTQKGKVGISIGTRWFEPNNSGSPDDATAAEVSFVFANYWFLNPLLGELGNYPEIMALEINVKSALRGYKESRLPIFTPDEVSFIKGSVDFIGINYFSTYRVRSSNSLGSSDYQRRNLDDEASSVEIDTSSEWISVNGRAYEAYDIKNTAENFGKLLKRLNNDYILPEIYVTANGYADSGEIHDVDRAAYHHHHIGELFNTMKSGVEVRGYIAWSLLDSFEWKDGYSKRYGIYGVNFTDNSRSRKRKLSATVIKNIFESKRVLKSLTIPEKY